MKKTIFICDRCGKETPTLCDTYIPYKTSIHGIVSHGFQLCPLCTKKYIEISKEFYSELMKNELARMERGIFDY